MAKKKVVEYEPGKYRTEIYEETTAAKPWGTYRTPEERAAEQRAAAQAANSPAAMRAKEVAEATAQAEALRAADRGTGWSAYRTPEERAAQHQAAIKAAEAAAEPLNPYPLGDVDPIYQKDTAGQSAGTAAGTASAGGGAGATTGTKQITTDEVLNKILNGDGYRYNLAADPTFQQLAAAARKEAKIEKADTLAHQTAATGGYGNTWAQAAAERAYDARMQQLYDQVPELEANAYNRYLNERAELKDQYQILAAREAAENEEAWKQKEWDLTLQQFEFDKEKWGKEYALDLAAQALNEKVANHDMSIQDAELILKRLSTQADVDKTNADIDLGYKDYDLNKYKTEQTVQQGWADIGIAQQNADTSRYNAYKSSNSGGGGEVPAADETDTSMYTGAVSLKTKDDWNTAVNEVLTALKRGTYMESMLYKYSYQNAYAVLTEAYDLYGKWQQDSANRSRRTVSISAQ